MAKANTYELERANKVKCKVCGFEGAGFYLWYYPTFMNGDAEVEAEFCNAHKKAGNQLLNELRKPLIEAARKRRVEEEKWQANEDSDIQANLDLLKTEGFDIKNLNNGYHYRINGILDIFPVGRNYHDIKKNKRGGYRRNRILADFIRTYLTSPS